MLFCMMLNLQYCSEYSVRSADVLVLYEGEQQTRLPFDGSQCARTASTRRGGVLTCLNNVIQQQVLECKE